MVELYGIPPPKTICLEALSGRVGIEQEAAWLCVNDYAISKNYDLHIIYDKIECVEDEEMIRNGEICDRSCSPVKPPVEIPPYPLRRRHCWEVSWLQPIWAAEVVVLSDVLLIGWELARIQFGISSRVHPLHLNCALPSRLKSLRLFDQRQSRL